MPFFLFDTPVTHLESHTYIYHWIQYLSYSFGVILYLFLPESDTIDRLKSRNNGPSGVTNPKHFVLIKVSDVMLSVTSSSLILSDITYLARRWIRRLKVRVTLCVRFNIIVTNVLWTHFYHDVIEYGFLFDTCLQKEGSQSIISNGLQTRKLVCSHR